MYFEVVIWQFRLLISVLSNFYEGNIAVDHQETTVLYIVILTKLITLCACTVISIASAHIYLKNI